MKLEIKTTTTTEVDIELPYYSKFGETYYKVISKKLIIAVSAYNSYLEIGKRELSGTHAFSNEAEKITEEEFWAAYNEVKDKLYNLTIGKELINDNS